MAETDTKWMTYAEIAQAFGIGADSARNLVRRKRWSRKTGNDGLARIGVPIDQITARVDVPTSGPIDPPTDGALNPPVDPPSLADGGAQVALDILREHIGRLEAEISGLKDELERERARATQVDALTAILEIERKRAEELRQERDKWAGMAEAGQRQLVEITKQPKGFLAWLRRG